MALGNQLQFKMGRFKDDQGNLILNNVAKKAGTVYVTTDEKAMYVDVDDSTRIRLGDVIQVDNSRSVKPPFSEDALYYFIEENALLKWGPFGTDGAMAWKQLNSVSDVTANLTALTNRVTEAEGAINTNKANIATNAAAIDALELTVDGGTDSEGNEIEGLVSKVSTLRSEVDVLNGDKDTVGSLKNVEDKVTTNATDITGLKNRLTTAEGTITSNTTLAQKGVDDAAAAKEAADAAQGDATQALTNAAAAQSKADQADGKADTNATNITGLGNRLDVLEPKVTTLEEKVKTVEETTIPGLTEDISKLRADLGTRGADEEDAFTRIKDLENTLGGSVEGGSVLDKLNTIDQTVTSHGTAITELQGASTSQGNKITNLEGKVGAPAEGETPSSGLFALVDDNAEAIDDHETRIDDLETKLPKLDERVTDAEDDIKSINTTLDGLPDVYVNEDDYATDKAALEAKIDKGLAEINETIVAANAMTYKGSVKTYAELPTTKVKIGDTYVIATDGGFTEGNEVYYAGDLLVATGAEEYTAEDFTPDENGNLSAEDEALIGTIKGEVNWDHVTTGYVATHNPELKAVDSETENAIDVKLSSFSGKETNAGDLGKFTIVGGENVVVSITEPKEGEIPVITIGMAWDTF